MSATEHDKVGEEASQAGPAPTEQRVGRIFGVLVSGLMSITFAGLFPLISLGFTTEWLAAWATGIAIGWPLGYALVSAATPPLRRLAVSIEQRMT